jgi:tRNA(Ile)-lysidine synthase TilS/MesJ
MENLLQHLTKIWQKYEIATSDSIVLGISGGIDSMVLLDLITQIHTIDKIIAVHIDHGIRTESESDATFVRLKCEKYGVSFDLLRRDIQKVAQDEKTSLEGAGRLVRY